MLNFASEKNNALLAKKYQAGRLVRLAPGIYSDDIKTPIDEQIRNPEVLRSLIGHRLKNARLAYRSALEWPNVQGQEIFFVDKNGLSFSFEETLTKFKIFKGTPSELSLVETLPWVGSVVIPTLPRAILENFSTRAVDRKKINRPLAEIRLQELLEKQAALGQGIDWPAWRNKFQQIGASLSLTKEAQLVNDLLCEWEATHKVMLPPTPYDWNHVRDFKKLAEEFGAYFEDWKEMEVLQLSNVGKTNQAMFESYFSNYIEGTELEIHYALEVMENHVSMTQSHLDEHDVLSTFLAIQKDIHTPPTLPNLETYLKQIKSWHSHLFTHRKIEVNAGDWKQKANRVGDTFFVEPALVKETLIRTFELAENISNPVARAFFLKLAFVTIHPFEDGNGRVSRLLMNTLLEQSGYNRLVLPTVLREDYLLSLKAWSTSRNINPFVRFVHKLNEINFEIPWEKPPIEILNFLDEKSAFSKPHEAKWGKKRGFLEEESFINLVKSVTPF